MSELRYPTAEDALSAARLDIERDAMDADEGDELGAVTVHEEFCRLSDGAPCTCAPIVVGPFDPRPSAEILADAGRGRAVS